MFLIFGIWTESGAIAGTICWQGDYCTPLTLIYVLFVIFLSDDVKYALASCVPRVELWGSYLHVDFAREMLPVVAVIIVVCMGDITLVRMLPWKKSVFYTESKGFPCISLMQLCLGVKTLQSIVSDMQITYLVSKVV